MLATKLKELRAKNKLTQAEFADIFSISKGTIAMWETGKRTPDIEMITRIADYFHVSVGYLVGQKQPDAEVNTVSDEDIKFALFDGADGITDEMYEEVKSFAEYIKSREESKRREKK